MALGNVMSREHRPTTRRGSREVCGLMDRGGTVTARWSRFTKLPELTFHAVPGDGTRELRFERLLAR